jgi:hypothetical protein
MTLLPSPPATQSEADDSHHTSQATHHTIPSMFQEAFNLITLKFYARIDPLISRSSSSLVVLVPFSKRLASFEARTLCATNGSVGVVVAPDPSVYSNSDKDLQSQDGIPYVMFPPFLSLLKSAADRGASSHSRRHMRPSEGSATAHKPRRNERRSHQRLDRFSSRTLGQHQFRSH